MGTLEFQTGRVVLLSKTIENLLKENYHAEGKGLHELTSSVEDLLKYDNISIGQIRKIASIRNKVVHNNSVNNIDIDEFEKLANNIINKLKSVNDVKEESHTKIIVDNDYIKNQKELSTSKSKPIIIITIIVVLIIYFLIPTSKNEKEINIELSNIKTQINIVEKNVIDINKKLELEKEKQGTLRSLFKDNDIVNNLEDKLNIEKVKLSEFIEKKNDLQLKLEEIKK